MPVWPHDNSTGSLIIEDTVFTFSMCILGYCTYDVNKINDMLTIFQITLFFTLAHNYFDKKIRNSYFFKK